MAHARLLTAVGCGRRFPRTTKNAFATATCWRPMSRSSLQSNIKLASSKKGKPIILNASISLSARGSVAWCERPSPFPKRPSHWCGPCDSSSSNTITVKHAPTCENLDNSSQHHQAQCHCQNLQCQKKLTTCFAGVPSVCSQFVRLITSS